MLFQLVTLSVALPDMFNAIWIKPPALKKCLRAVAPANVTVKVPVRVAFHGVVLVKVLEVAVGVSLEASMVFLLVSIKVTAAS